MATETAAHVIERGLFKQLLVLGHALLSLILQTRIEQYSVSIRVKGTYKDLESKGREMCHYLSLFGQLVLVRPSY